MNLSCFLRRFCCTIGFVEGTFKTRFSYRNIQVAQMGLLTEGSPLSWDETKALAEHVRQHGIEQFINLYSKLRDRTGDVLKWGDEVRQF